MAPSSQKPALLTSRPEHSSNEAGGIHRGNMPERDPLRKVRAFPRDKLPALHFMKFLPSGVGSVCLILDLLVSPAEAATFTVTNGRMPGLARCARPSSTATRASPTE